MQTSVEDREDIAIVGMAAHLPGAETIFEFWDNLRAGKSSIRKLSEEELKAAGETPEHLHHPNYVRASGTMTGVDMFEPDFFGFSPKEGAIMDPQHRHFLEACWEAFENAGHAPDSFPGNIGVFAGCGMGSYFYFNLCTNPDLVGDVGLFLLRHTGNDKDFLATRASHVFDLRGPSVNVQTACSTSLVATHYACNALISGECDMALAGGVTIEIPHGRGYIFKENEVLSPDGECHAFDHRAQGTVFGSGSGVVVLRRLKDAIADGDHIWGVIRGTAVNNDGATKAGYLAPSVDGQAAAIAEAHLMAGVTADTIDYIECHGTGTYLGDPIEIAALTEAFSGTTDETGFCRIGSVKTNIGHLDTAAGVASLIKAAMALHHKEIPPSLGYEAPNPAIDFEHSPFFVNDTLTEWVSHKGPRRAGINSLGVGGTNAHVIVEEAPERPASEASDWPFHILAVSGRNKGALEDNAAALAAHLRAHPEQPLEDVSFTLIEGRKAFEKRRVLVAESHEQAAEILEGKHKRRVFDHEAVGADPDIVFMFPGGGAQYAGMARDLYETEPVFREWMDRGIAHLQPKLDYDFKALWLPEPGAEEAADETLRAPWNQLTLIMMTEYALAQLWMSWGVTPAAMIGHSLGEYTASCLAGVMSFEDCIDMVHKRGDLMKPLPKSGMMSVPMDAEELRPLLGEDLEMASVNAPGLCVATGYNPDLDALEKRLAEHDIEGQRVQVDIAGHSKIMDPILQEFGDFVRTLTLGAPQMPVMSNRTGTEMTGAQSTDPQYWVDHLRRTVNFSDGLAKLAEAGKNRVYIEMGPGKALTAFARMQPGITANQIVSALRHPEEDVADDVYFMEMFARLWAMGVEMDWSQIWGEAKRQRVVLPTYRFQRARYYIEPGRVLASETQDMLLRTENPEDWGWRPVWRPRLADCDVDTGGDLKDASQETWLVFRDDAGLGATVAGRLRDAGHTVIDVASGDGFARSGDHSYVLNPERGREAFDQLVADLVERGITPTRVAHFWLTTATEKFRPGSSFFHRNQEHGFYTLLYLMQALADEEMTDGLHVTAITSGAAQVRDEALPYPEKSTVMGPIRVMPRELPGVTASALDVELPGRRLKKAEAQAALDDLAARVLEDLLARPDNAVAALRGTRRYELDFRQFALEPTEATPFKKGGVVLITGGFGGIGMVVAEHLAREMDAKIVLMSRRPLPERDTWAGHIRKYGPADPTSQAIAAVERLERIGAVVKPAQADVCNLEQMRRLREEVEKDLGPVSAVIHAAGAVDDGPMLAKDDMSIEPVFAAKIHGTQVLDQVFPDGTLDLMVLFSSSSTVTAPPGQVDYVAANEYLNAFAKSRTGGKTRVVALGWGIWAEVGMAAAAMADRLGQAPALPPTPTDTVLLTQASFDAAGERVLTGKLTTGDWVIDEHRSGNRDAFLPGTGYLELAAQAMAAQDHDGPFTVSDLIFLRPLQVTEDQPRDIRIRLEREDGGYRFALQSDAMFKGKAGWQLNAQGTLVPGARAKGGGSIDIAAIRNRCETREDGGGTALEAAQAKHLNFGPRWSVLRETAYGTGEGIARLSLDDAYLGDLEDGYRLHPALLDIATGWAMDLIEGYKSAHLWVPIAYEAVRVLRPLPGEIVSWVKGHKDNRSGNPIARFDVVLADMDGNVCVEVEGFQIKMIENAADLTRPAPLTEREVEIEGASDARPLSPSEERLRQNISQGITPPEGALLFSRALAEGVPQVLISSLDLNALAAQIAAGAETTEGDGQKFERPDLDSTYVAPRTGIEATLADLWEDLLGVSQVGVEDDFFALGGHSLIAVRLFATIKKTYQADFPISVLFEAPTIEKCAALIAERVGGDTALGEEGEAAPVAPRAERKFTHVVPMHAGDPGPKTPIFMVAGMFGNVMNLRHIAHLLSKDRGFYGLQARGLYGGEAPHETLVEAAEAYIAEMRQVQPEGPYILAGFSGGGLTAYEMARQLKEAGQETSLLILLDTALAQRPVLTRKDRALIKLQQLQREGLGYLSKWARDRYRWEMSKIRNRFGGPETVEEHQFHNAEIEAAFYRAIGVYDHHVYEGRTVLYRPPLDTYWKVSGGQWVDRGGEYIYPDNNFGQYIPNLEVVEVPGDHDSMVLEPSVRVLADRIRMAIREAEEAADSWPAAAE